MNRFQKKNINKFRLRKNTTIVVAFILFELIAILLLYNQFKIKSETYFSKKTSELEIAYKAITGGYNSICQTIFSEIINKPEVISIIHKAVNDVDPPMDSLRAELYELLRVSNKNLYETNHIHLHFQLPDCTSFLRFYSPEKFGDKLEESRLSVKKANLEKMPVNGFEVGSFYHGYRYIYPLFSENVHVGSVEIGISSREILTELQRIFGQHFRFILNKNVLSPTIIQSEMQQFSTCDLDTSYLRDITTLSKVDEPNQYFLNEDQIKEINYDVRRSYNRKADQMKAFAMTSTLQNNHLIIAFVPVFNFKGTHVAYLIGYFVDSTIENYYNDFTQYSILVTFLLSLSFFLLYYIGRSLVLLRNSRDKLRSITDNLNDGLIILDTKKRIQDINPAAEKLLGEYKHTVIGREVSKILVYRSNVNTGKESETWANFDMINFGLSYKSKQGFYILRDHSPVPIEISVSPRYLKGEKVGYIIVFKEI